MNVFDEKILIFGGTGSLGKKLIERFKTNNEVAIYSRDESKQWTIKNEMNVPNVRFFVGDIRDEFRVNDVVRLFKPTIIIIAAALKQVDTCEMSPLESIKTNLLGTQNVINASHNHGPYGLRVLFVSTDKACSPVNVYGMCKSVSERLVTSQAIETSSNIKYLATRYGNVLESRGSIIPLFKYQAENNQYLTVTDPNMTRFVMTLDDSVDLIETTLTNGSSGETWIPCLSAMRIGDLADIFSKRYKKGVKVTGLRPGEKQHEDLVNESESVRTYEHRIDVGFPKHYVIRPAFCTGDVSNRFTYSSNDDVMSRDELERHLTKLGVLERPLSSFTGKSIEEIRK